MATFSLVDSNTPLYINLDTNLCFVLPNQITGYPYPVGSVTDFGFCIPLFFKHNNYVDNRIVFQTITTVPTFLNVINSSYFRDENGVVHSVYKASSDYIGVVELSSIPEFLNLDDYIINDGAFGFGFYLNNFTTNLYQELLDNSEQFQMAKSFLNDTDPSKQLDPTFWTDIQLKFFKFVEEYNKNVISLRASKKVNANVSGSISQSGQSDIDLTPISQGLIRIANNLQYTNTDDITKGLAQIEYDKDNSVLVQNNLVESAPFNPHLQKNDLFEG